MERKHDLIEGEYYHVFNRGVEKRAVFISPADYERFLALLLITNRKGSISMRDIQKKYRGEPSGQVFISESGSETLVDIAAYALMPNHLHLVLRERVAGGISKFMLKLLTGYSMYFNTKYERSGPLFVRPYRSRHVDSDEYLRWLLAYIYLNPLALHQPDWKERGIASSEEAASFLHGYRYSSFFDLVSERGEKSILSEILPFPSSEISSIDSLIGLLAREPLDSAVY